MTSAGEVVLETDRLLLRRWRVSDAAFQRQLWTERDPRVPPHRIGGDGHPTLEDIEGWIRSGDPDPSLGLLVAERRGSADAVGYCGLIPNVRGQDGEPELAYEFLHLVWRQGYATEAARPVVRFAFSDLGAERLTAGWFDDNTASGAVLHKLLTDCESLANSCHAAARLRRTARLRRRRRSDYRRLLASAA